VKKKVIFHIFCTDFEENIIWKDLSTTNVLKGSESTKFLLLALLKRKQLKLHDVW